MTLRTDVARWIGWGFSQSEDEVALHVSDHNTLHTLHNKVQTAYDLPVAGATFVIGAEGSDIINVGIQLLDNEGDALAVVGNVFAYLSDASTGIDISAAAPDDSVVIGTDGDIIVEHTTDLAWDLQSEADGDIDLDIKDVTGTPTWYLVVVMPSGLQVVSEAITFA